MRILSIELAGFLSYNVPQFIDFSEANVFCISGPNGAGKSSILDAIVYALYGKIPRYAGRRINTEEDIINHRSDRLSLSLKFKVGDRVFLVKRELVRGKSQQVNIYELIDDRPVTLGIRKNKEVNAYIESLLGMDYETFTKTVILPQNQIDRFLKPAGSEALSERRQVLQRLLGLDIYKKIKKLANQKFRDISNELQMISNRLEVELKGYTKDYVKSLERNLKEKENALKELEEKKQVINLEIERLKSTISLFEDYLSDLESLKDITERLEIVKSEKENADRLETLYYLQGEIKPFLNLNREFEEKKKRLEVLINEKMRLERDKGKFYLSLEEEKKNVERYKEYIDYSNKLLELVELSNKIKELERDKSSLKDIERELKTREKELLSIEDDIKRLSLEIELCNSRLKELKDKFRSESEGWDKIRGILTDIKELKIREKEFDELLEKEKGLVEDRSKLEGELSSLSKDIESLSTEISKMEEELERYHLEKIKMSLSIGDICPICGNIIGSLPVNRISLQLIEELNSRYQQKKRIYEFSSRKYAEINAKLEQTNRDIKETEISLRELDRYIKEKKVEISNILEPYFGRDYPLDERILEDRIERDRRYLEELINRLEREREVKLTQVRERRERLSRENENLRSIKMQFEAERERIKNTEESLLKRVSSIGLNWEDFIKRDFLSESQEIKSKYQKLLDISNSNISKYSAYIERIETRVLEISKEIGSLKEDMQNIQKEIDSMKRDLEMKCNSVGSSLEELFNLKIDKNSIDKIKRDFEELSIRQTLIKDKISIYRENIIKIGFDPDNYGGLESLKNEYSVKLNSLKDLEKNITELSKEIGSLDIQLKNAKEQISLVESLSVRRKELERQASYYKVIDDALSENRFPEFLIRELMENIINRASLELSYLTQGRYSFSLASEDSADILINDNWYPDRSRKTYSLSGGESFLASIALAIAIAEEIRGKRSVDCLFIDEGFGSLDDTGLDSIVSALSELENSGIMIGVITHNKELASRFPYRIEVEKDERGSRIKGGQ